MHPHTPPATTISLHEHPHTSQAQAAPAPDVGSARMESYTRSVYMGTGLRRAALACSVFMMLQRERRVHGM